MACCDDNKRWLSGGLNYGKIPEYWKKRFESSAQKALKGDNENVNSRFVRRGFTPGIKY